MHLTISLFSPLSLTITLDRHKQETREAEDEHRLITFRAFQKPSDHWHALQSLIRNRRSQEPRNFAKLERDYGAFTDTTTTILSAESNAFERKVMDAR